MTDGFQLTIAVADTIALGTAVAGLEGGAPWCPPFDAEMRTAMDADPAYAAAVRHELRQQEALYRAWQAPAGRPTGVAWSGIHVLPGPDGFRRITLDQLRRKVAADMARNAHFAASPRGRLCRAVGKADALAREVVEAQGRLDRAVNGAQALAAGMVRDPRDWARAAEELRAAADRVHDLAHRLGAAADAMDAAVADGACA